MKQLKERHFGAITSKTDNSLYGFSRIGDRIGVFKMVPVCVVESKDEQDMIGALRCVLQRLGADLDEYLANQDEPSSVFN